jgi:valyl-tRNA synthetase
MIKEYPKAGEIDNTIDEQFKLAIEAIVSIRRCKTLVDMANKKLEKAYVEFNNDIDKELVKPYIQKLAKVENLEFVDSKPANAVTDVSDNLKSYISTDDIDLAPIIKKLENQKAKLEKEIAKLNGMLNNEKFVSNAPANVIEQNKNALQAAQDKLAKVEEELKAFA